MVSAPITVLQALSGLIHDVGKLTIPNEILQKQGPLTAAERRLIQTHPRRGHHILKRHANIPDEALNICLHHHEVLDGSGYPFRLSGSEIGRLVRLSTVCDVFEALTSARPHKRGWAVSEALNWMFDQNHLFDRKLVLRLGAIINDFQTPLQRGLLILSDQCSISSMIDSTRLV